ncbi:unnamed protein product [Closterium sp. NIES-53]
MLVRFLMNHSECFLLSSVLPSSPFPLPSCPPPLTHMPCLSIQLHPQAITAASSIPLTPTPHRPSLHPFQAPCTPKPCTVQLQASPHFPPSLPCHSLRPPQSAVHVPRHAIRQRVLHSFFSPGALPHALLLLAHPAQGAGGEGVQTEGAGREVREALGGTHGQERESRGDSGEGMRMGMGMDDGGGRGEGMGMGSSTGMGMEGGMDVGMGMGMDEDDDSIIF